MSTISSEIRTLIGKGSGLLFITATKSFLDQHEEIKVGSLDVTDSRKLFLMVLVTTLHSFSEGLASVLVSEVSMVSNWESLFRPALRCTTCLRV